MSGKEVPTGEKPDDREFEVTLEMIRAGVKRYLAFDPEEDEPESLIAEILYTARDMHSGKLRFDDFLKPQHIRRDGKKVGRAE